MPLNNGSPSHIPLQIQQFLFVSPMENNRVPSSPPKKRNNHPPFPFFKCMDQTIDSPRFEKRLISQGNENSLAMRMDGLKASPYGTAHPLFGMGVHDNPYFFPLK